MGAKEMRIPEILKSRTFISVCFVAILGMLFVFSQIAGRVHNLKANRNVNSQINSITTAQEEANQAEQAANIASKTREIEDQVRASSITPKLAHARSQSEKSRITLKLTRQKYETAKIPHPDHSPDSVLHERNCAQFHELYPELRIENCR